jgi:hypothetical protein
LINFAINFVLNYMINYQLFSPGFEIKLTSSYSETILSRRAC